MSGVAAATAPLSANKPCVRAERGSRLTLTRLMSVSIASPMNQKVSARPIATWTGNGRLARRGHDGAELGHVPVGAESSSAG